MLQRDVSAGYLSMLGVTLLRGRMFTSMDDAKHPRVTIINESLARKYFPGENPLGKRIGDGSLSPGSMREVVGVIGDLREGALNDAMWPAEYFPINQSTDSSFTAKISAGGIRHSRHVVQEFPL